MHYLALFTIPLIPLAFAYMPMFAARNGGFSAGESSGSLVSDAGDDLFDVDIDVRGC